jgi:hypothetical protein
MIIPKGKNGKGREKSSRKDAENAKDAKRGA